MSVYCIAELTDQRGNVMRKLCLFLLMIISAMGRFDSSRAQIDPILLDEPNDKVFQCGELLFIELPEPAQINYSVAGRSGNAYFIFFKTEVLFLEETGWNGLDKSSFVLVQTDEEGTETSYPLDLVVTSLASLQFGWKSLSAPLYHTSLTKYILAFDVPTADTKNWSLLFRPAERGGQAYCEIQIPVYFK